MTVLDLLDRLVAFPSVSSAPNRDIAGFVAAHLSGLGFAVHELPDATGGKIGILARIGEGQGGLCLSAHMDVVPVEGQAWTRPAFRLTREGGRLYGRGTTDMKGFLACALGAAARRAASGGGPPLILSLSYDEEIGCRGIAAMIGALPGLVGRPDWVLVGEPTGLRIATGHKGKAAYRAEFTGVAGHSASAPLYLNALHLAADFIALLRREQEALAATGASDPAYDIRHSTIHAGRMRGGIALNIVPDRAEVEFEIRFLPGDRLDDIIGRIRAGAGAIVAAAGHPQARIVIAETNRYPGLDTGPGHPAVARLRAAGAGPAMKVAYGTEAGIFAEAGLPALVCGPGDMAQGHQPDEFVDLAQIEACSALLGRLVTGHAA